MIQKKVRYYDFYLTFFNNTESKTKHNYGLIIKVRVCVKQFYLNHLSFFSWWPSSKAELEKNAKSRKGLTLNSFGIYQN